MFEAASSSDDESMRVASSAVAPLDVARAPAPPISGTFEKLAFFSVSATRSTCAELALLVVVVVAVAVFVCLLALVVAVGAVGGGSTALLAGFFALRVGTASLNIDESLSAS